MDPRSCLRDAYDEMLNQEWCDMFDHLEAYWTWRDKGGFEPPSGDLVSLLIEAAYGRTDPDYLARLKAALGRYLGTE